MIDCDQKVSSGSVLVYLVVLILIFGILGAAMVSLFTTSSTSSATRNDARRAFYMAESAVRYAFSELRHSSFSPAVFNALNTTTYNAKDAESFTINAFSPWFASAKLQILSAGNILELTVPTGKIPPGFTIPDGSRIINFEYTDPTIDGAKSQIANYTRIDDRTLQLTVSDQFNAAKGERVCLLFSPSHDHIVSQDGDLYVDSVVKDFFPPFNGAIKINGFDYSYYRLIDETENSRVKLTNLTKFPRRSELILFTLNISQANDLIILSPRNYMVIPTGMFASSKPHGNHYEYREGLYDYAPEKPTPPDINADEFTSNFIENETSQSFIGVDTAADTLNFGGGMSPGSQIEFATGWYNANKSIGGRNGFCQSGRCLFGLGVRVFFILKFINGLQGDGLTFTLMNSEGREVLPPNNLLNDINSVGGDFELSELMGYAGDSRMADGGFLDPTDPRGIQRPKLAIEFDTQTNFDPIFESQPEPKNYCIDSLSLKNDTRNDPLSGSGDAIQYVFWGDNALNVPCRSANPSGSVDTYDDNRHGTIEAPINDKDIAITSIAELDSNVVADNSNDWLNGSILKGPWAIRIEIERVENLDAGGNFNNSLYTIRTWIRQCATEEGSFNCTDASIIGARNPFQSTRLKYDFVPEGVTRLEQQFALTENYHNAFERFYFGFTGAAGPEALDAEISQFQLSFIRLGDPIVTNDLNWTP